MLQVYCEGYIGCRDSVIRNAKYIESTGENALYSMTIISEISDDKADGTLYSYSDNGTLINVLNKTLTIRLNSDITVSSNIYCNQTDICQIDCQSDYSCSSLNLYCYGICNVKCNQVTDTIYCPNVIVGNFSYWGTAPPTYFPTVSPTPYPTQNYINYAKKTFYIGGNYNKNNNATTNTDHPSDYPTSLPSNKPTQSPSDGATSSTINTTIATTPCSDTFVNIIYADGIADGVFDRYNGIYNISTSGEDAFWIKQSGSIIGYVSDDEELTGYFVLEDSSATYLALSFTQAMYDDWVINGGTKVSPVGTKYWYAVHLEANVIVSLQIEDCFGNQIEFPTLSPTERPSNPPSDLPTDKPTQSPSIDNGRRRLGSVQSSCGIDSPCESIDDVIEIINFDYNNVGTVNLDILFSNSSNSSNNHKFVTTWTSKLKLNNNNFNKNDSSVSQLSVHGISMDNSIILWDDTTTAISSLTKNTRDNITNNYEYNILLRNLTFISNNSGNNQGSLWLDNEFYGKTTFSLENIVISEFERYSDSESLFRYNNGEFRLINVYFENNVFNCSIFKSNSHTYTNLLMDNVFFVDIESTSFTPLIDFSNRNYTNLESTIFAPLITMNNIYFNHVDFYSNRLINVESIYPLNGFKFIFTDWIIDSCSFNVISSWPSFIWLDFGLDDFNSSTLMHAFNNNNDSSRSSVINDLDIVNSSFDHFLYNLDGFGNQTISNVYISNSKWTDTLFYFWMYPIENSSKIDEPSVVEVLGESLIVENVSIHDCDGAGGSVFEHYNFKNCEFRNIIVDSSNFTTNVYDEVVQNEEDWGRSSIIYDNISIMNIVVTHLVLSSKHFAFISYNNIFMDNIHFPSATSIFSIRGFDAYLSHNASLTNIYVDGKTSQTREMIENYDDNYYGVYYGIEWYSYWSYSSLFRSGNGAYIYVKNMTMKDIKMEYPFYFSCTVPWSIGINESYFAIVMNDINLIDIDSRGSGYIFYLSLNGNITIENLFIDGSNLTWGSGYIFWGYAQRNLPSSHFSVKNAQININGYYRWMEVFYFYNYGVMIENAMFFFDGDEYFNRFIYTYTDSSVFSSCFLSNVVITTRKNSSDDNNSFLRIDNNLMYFGHISKVVLDNIVFENIAGVDERDYTTWSLLYIDCTYTYVVCNINITNLYFYGAVDNSSNTYNDSNNHNSTYGIGRIRSPIYFSIDPSYSLDPYEESLFFLKNVVLSNFNVGYQVINIYQRVSKSMNNAIIFDSLWMSNLVGYEENYWRYGSFERAMISHELFWESDTSSNANSSYIDDSSIMNGIIQVSNCEFRNNINLTIVSCAGPNYYECHIIFENCLFYNNTFVIENYDNGTYVETLYNVFFIGNGTNGSIIIRDSIFVGNYDLENDNTDSSFIFTPNSHTNANITCVNCVFYTTAPPTTAPTYIPSIHPTNQPSSNPTGIPTIIPTNNPANNPTSTPTTGSSSEEITSSNSTFLTVTDVDVSLEALSVNDDNATFNPGFRNIFQSTITINLNNEWAVNLFQQWFDDNDESVSMNITNEWETYDIFGNLNEIPSDLVHEYTSHDLTCNSNGSGGVYSVTSYYVLYPRNSISIFSTSICDDDDSNKYFESGNDYQFKNSLEISYIGDENAVETVSTISISDSLTLSANSPPQNGTCKIMPISGEPLTDLFNISCDGWIDDNGEIKYNFIYGNGIFLRSFYNESPVIHTHFGYGDNIPIIVVIMDDYLLPTCYHMSISTHFGNGSYVARNADNLHNFTNWIVSTFENSVNETNDEDQVVIEQSLIAETVYALTEEYDILNGATTADAARLQTTIINLYIEAIIDEIDTIEEAAIVLTILSQITVPLIDHNSSQVFAVYNSTLISNILEMIQDPLIYLFQESIINGNLDSLDSDVAQYVFGMSLNKQQ